mmetsp:Transcript_3311/g.4993  ORF Transcript_3311/g.4993 Transcript_3311/m.4993 type:complete len:188 (+) Transcript_3311:293-856(+)
MSYIPEGKGIDNERRQVSVILHRDSHLTAELHRCRGSKALGTRFDLFQKQAGPNSTPYKGTKFHYNLSVSIMPLPLLTEWMGPAIVTESQASLVTQCRERFFGVLRCNFGSAPYSRASHSRIIPDCYNGPEASIFEVNKIVDETVLLTMTVFQTALLSPTGGQTCHSNRNSPLSLKRQGLQNQTMKE